jgi:hypothetical protein
MDNTEAHIRELLLRIRDLEQELDGLRVELRRLVAESLHGAKSHWGQGGATVYAA